MVRHRRWVTVLVSVMVLTLTACNGAELEEAQSQVEALEEEVAALEASTGALEAESEALAADKEALAADNEALETEKAALEETMAAQGQALILQADIVGEGCMLQNTYLNDGEAKATFRVRVYDPLTGEQLDDEALESLVVIIDGQEFELHYGPHPPDTENDFFWSFGWEIFEGYPAGNVEYSIVATATDGRTGEFDIFNVAPSLLTVVDVNAEEGSGSDA